MGNTRLAYREQGPQQRYPATMVSPLVDAQRAQQEENTFNNIAASRNGEQSCTGATSAKVTNARVLGPWKTIKVGKGDKLNMKVKALYLPQASPGSSTRLKLYVSSPANAPTSGTEQLKKEWGLLNVGVGVSPDFSPSDNSVPRAYLQYLFYDNNHKLVSQQRQAVSVANQSSCLGELTLDFDAQEDGYVQVLVANESEQAVWFDDLEISYTPGLIVQENHYDPWGMNLAGIEKQGTYSYQFNASSEKQADGLGQGYFYETDLRGYDPQLGRFRGVDVLAGSMPGISPYQFSFNNPVMFSDPRGDTPHPAVLGAVAGAVVGGVAGGLINQERGGNFWSGFAAGAAIGAAAGAGIGYAYEYGAANQTASWLETSMTRSGELGRGTRGVQGVGVAAQGSSVTGAGTAGFIEAESNRTIVSLNNVELSKMALNVAILKARLFSNETEAYNFMWKNSVDEKGNVISEVAAWLTNRGVLVLPTSNNTGSESDMFMLPTKDEKGNYFTPDSKKVNRNVTQVLYNNQWINVLGSIHTHPNGWEDSPSGGDFEFLRRHTPTRPIFTIGIKNVWAGTLSSPLGYYHNVGTRDQLLQGKFKLIPNINLLYGK